MVADRCDEELNYNMRALSRRNDDPQGASRPFDATRDGFVMGEGARMLVLEDLKSARARGARIPAEMVGDGATADAYHVTEPAPPGAGLVRAMSRALGCGIYPLLIASSSELSYQPCKAHSFLSGVRDGQRIDRQFIHPCCEQFEQPVLDLVFIPKDQQTFHQGV
jgi:hypothetical protein